MDHWFGRGCSYKLQIELFLKVDQMHLELSELIQPAVAMAQRYAVRRQELVVSEKSAGEFVSEADEAIEATIRSAIAERFGNVAVIGEEQGGALGADTSGWAIDPIDGTTNFLRGLPMWGISVGVIQQGVPIAGVLALPAENLLLVAEPKDQLRVNGRPFTRSNLTGGQLIALGENDFEPYDRTDQRARELRAQGYAVARYRSAVFSLASAALGRVDGYVEHGCFIWDIAGAVPVLQAVGLVPDFGGLSEDRYFIDARTKGGVLS
jgi:myo-inositol-1(or 4)-monophosphatase